MIKALLAYQETDAKLRKIEVELSGSEERKKAMSAKKYLEGVEESVAKLESRASELVGAYESATKQQLKLKEQEDEISRAINTLEDQTEASYLLKKADELLESLDASHVPPEIGDRVREFAESVRTTI